MSIDALIPGNVTLQLYPVQPSLQLQIAAGGRGPKGDTAGLEVAESPIDSGIDTRVLYNNNGKLGEYAVSGSGSVAMTDNPDVSILADGSSAQRTLQDRFSDTANVLDFGAVGDDDRVNTASIQAAVDATPTNGKLYIPRGVFLTGKVALKSNITVCGEGVLKATAALNDSILYGGGVSNVSLVGFRIDGNRENQSTEAPAILFESVDSATQFMNISVSDLSLTECLGGGIHIMGGKSCRVYGNSVKNISGSGAAIIVASDGAANSESCSVFGNTIDNVGGAGINAMGNSRNNSVVGNTVRDWNSSDYNSPGTSYGDAITAYDIDNLSLVVSGNQCLNTGKCTGGHGIHIGGYRSAVVGNTIDSPVGSGIYVSGRQTTSAPTNDITIIGNNVFKTTVASPAIKEAGIYARSVNGISIAGNNISGAGAVDSGGNGIALQICSAFNVTGNVIRLVGRSGISIDREIGDSTLSSRGLISNNAIYQAYGNAIDLDYVGQCQVGGNYIFDSDVAGGLAVNIGSNTSIIDCLNNNIRDGGTSPFSTHASATNIRFKNNRVSNSATNVDVGSIASASPLVLTPYFDTYTVSGNTNFSAISGGWPGRIVDLIFSGTPTITHGSALKLPGELPIDAVSDDRLRLYCVDGTNYVALAYVKKNGKAIIPPAFSEVTSKPTLTGTANEIAVAAGDWSGTPTFSLPSTVDLSAKRLPGVWRRLGGNAVAVDHTGNTSETVLATVSVPAGAMGANGRVRVRANWRYTNSANIKTPRIRFGGLSGTEYFGLTVTTTATVTAEAEICNRNSVSSQIGGGSRLGTGLSGSATGPATSSIDTSSAVDIVITGQLANAGETIALDSFEVDVMYVA